MWSGISGKCIDSRGSRWPLSTLQVYWFCGFMFIPSEILQKWFLKFHDPIHALWLGESRRGKGLEPPVVGSQAPPQSCWPSSFSEVTEENVWFFGGCAFPCWTNSSFALYLSMVTCGSSLWHLCFREKHLLNWKQKEEKEREKEIKKKERKKRKDF